VTKKKQQERGQKKLQDSRRERKTIRKAKERGKKEAIIKRPRRRPRKKEGDEG